MKHIPTEGAGKGDSPRPVNKKQYDENYIRCFGSPCPVCTSQGYNTGADDKAVCKTCNGLGKVDKYAR